jgi:hypothetical protein
VAPDPHMDAKMVKKMVKKAAKKAVKKEAKKEAAYDLGIYLDLDYVSGVSIYGRYVSGKTLIATLHNDINKL